MSAVFTVLHYAGANPDPDPDPDPNPNQVSSVFTVLHYAGAVTYSVARCLDFVSNPNPISRHS